MYLVCGAALVTRAPGYRRPSRYLECSYVWLPDMSNEPTANPFLAYSGSAMTMIAASGWNATWAGETPAYHSPSRLWWHVRIMVTDANDYGMRYREDTPPPNRFGDT